MIDTTARFRQAIGVALIAGMAVLAGCGSTPTSTTTTSERSTTITPAPPVTTSTTTTNSQTQRP
jgi:hypothetical protein